MAAGPETCTVTPSGASWVSSERRVAIASAFSSLVSASTGTEPMAAVPSSLTIGKGGGPSVGTPGGGPPGAEPASASDGIPAGGPAASPSDGSGAGIRSRREARAAASCSSVSVPLLAV